MLESSALVFYACAAMTAVLALVMRRITIPSDKATPRAGAVTWPHPTPAR
jgi:hypothetical protein